MAYRVDICEGDPKRDGWHTWRTGTLRFPDEKQATNFAFDIHQNWRTHTSVVQTALDSNATYIERRLVTKAF